MPSGPVLSKGQYERWNFNRNIFFADCTNKWRGNPKQANVY